jgi:hypothetical protein
VKDINGNSAYGFLVDQADFNQLKNITGNVSVYLRLAIKNYKDSMNIQSGTANPEFTIQIIPVNMTDTSVIQNKGLDFVCPCPGNPCCPKG